MKGYNDSALMGERPLDILFHMSLVIGAGLFRGMQGSLLPPEYVVRDEFSSYIYTALSLHSLLFPFLQYNTDREPNKLACLGSPYVALLSTL